MGQTKNNMIFRKVGGKYQLLIATPADLKYIPQLDEAHWIATGAPTQSFTCDAVFLKYLDTDINGRIRTDELKDALSWLFLMLKDISILEEKTSNIQLDSINTEEEAGKQIRTAAERILSNLKAKDKTTITLEQTRSNQQILSSGECNGDGVIPADSIDDEKTSQLVNDIIATIGSTDDASGKKGITAEHLEKFLTEAKAYIEWYDQGSLKKNEKSTPVMIRGKDTVPAYTTIKAVQGKLDEYFTHCKMLQIDDAIEKRFHPAEKTIDQLDMNNPEAMSAYMTAAPLDTPNKNLILKLEDQINPVYNDSIKAFIKTVFNDKIKQISYSDWEEVKAEFANFANWDNGKLGAIVEPLGIDLLREYVKGKQTKKLQPLFKKDLAVAAEIQQIANVEKLLLYKQLILDFANDFVSLSRLFDPSLNSMIQVGKLVMDGRHFDLNVKLADKAGHKKIAIKSNICVMYITATSKTGDVITKMDVATGVTSGNISNLYIGKRGVFFTPDGKEWDAEVIDFIRHPVSISEALWMPFVKLGEFLKKQTDKFTSSGYQKLEKGVGDSITNIEKTAGSTKQQPAKTSWTGPLMLLGGGIGIAGLGSAFASVTNALKTISIVQVLMFLGLIIIIVALPIIIAAIIKLRKRNVGMFLEASGWAMNSSIRLTHKVGLLFTRTPSLPENSSKRYFDHTSILLKNADFQKRAWPFKLFVVIVTLAIAIAIGIFCRKFFNTDKVLTGAPVEVNK